MRTPLLLLLPTMMLAAACSPKLAINTRPHETSDNLILVKGGSIKSTRSRYHGKETALPDFYIAKYEVTQKEWAAVMGNNPSRFKGDNLPVEMISWYDAVDYCNQRSIREGLKPYYRIDRDRKDARNNNNLDDEKWTVAINAGANGYRLPTDAEWEYAASGAQLTRSRLYSGSDDVEKVAWYWRNSGDAPLAGLWHWPTIEQNNNRTKPVGSKEPNELGLYDMSGNVREWCWDWLQDLEPTGKDPNGEPIGSLRVWRGGGWMGGEFCCETSFRAGFEPNGFGPDQGLRLCRDR